MIGLIENEIERDLNQCADMSETLTDCEEVTESRTQTAVVGDCESVSEEVGEQLEEQESTVFFGRF